MRKLNVDMLNINQGGNKQMGRVVKELMTNGVMDPGAARPWMDPETGMSYVTVYDPVKKGDPADLNSYMNIPLNTNATLMKDEWEQLETDIMSIARERLVGVQDLMDNGMTWTLNNPMATPVLTHQRGAVEFSPEMTMDGVTRSQGNRPSFDYESTPVPILHVDFDINQRDLLVSRNQGNGIDTIDAQQAARDLNEYLESMLFDSNYSFQYAGGKIQGYTNFDDRVQGTLSKAWNASGKTGQEIVQDVINMKQDSKDNYHYGPFILYIPTNYETKLDEDYDTTRGNTIYERLLQIQQIQDVKVVPKLPDDNLVLVELKRENIHWVEGLGMQTIEWSEDGGMVNKYKVITIQFPRIRSDKYGRIGLVHWTT